MRKIAIVGLAMLAACGGPKSNTTPVDTTLPAGTHAVASADVDNASADLNAAANDAISDINSALDNAAAAAPDVQPDMSSGPAEPSPNPYPAPDGSQADPTAVTPSNGLN